MKAIPRIPTKRPLIERIWETMEISWWPAITIYAIGAAVIIVAKWSSL